MRKAVLFISALTIASAFADSATYNPNVLHKRIKVGENERGMMCTTIHGRKFFKFSFPPKLELIDKFEAERVPYMTVKNHVSPADKQECIKFINKLRDYRTGVRKPIDGRTLTMEDWDILVEGALVKCC